MKYIFVILLIVLSLSSSAQGDNPFIKTYHFGAYTVKTGFCDYLSKIEIFYRDSLVTLFCNGEGGGYSLADTITLNDDNIPDFICSHRQEDAYFYIELLVSQSSHSYKKIDVNWNSWTLLFTKIFKMKTTSR